MGKKHFASLRPLQHAPYSVRPLMTIRAMQFEAPGKVARPKDDRTDHSPAGDLEKEATVDHK
jgi:hypothetical protein